MSALPIIMSAPMVRAILREIEAPGTGKTATRRLALKPVRGGNAARPSEWLKVQPGDRLWVRENWAQVPASAYRRSDGVFQTINPTDEYEAAIYAAGWDRSIPKWRPSIHMPRWASRLTLEVTAVKVERLQNISEEDALAEGVVRVKDACYVVRGFGYDTSGLCHSNAVTAYAMLWMHLHGDEAWDANPEVVAITFKPVLQNIDKVAA